MIKHHPEFSMLAEYAAGNLDWGLSLAVCAHLQMCPCCRHEVDQLNRVGGALLANSGGEKQDVSDEQFRTLMENVREQEAKRIVSSEMKKFTAPQVPKRQFDGSLVKLPKVVEKLVAANKRLSWKRVSSSLKMARLKSNQSKYEIAFHKICSGGRVPEHDHRGLEATVVLSGSFSDGDGIYQEGDFLLRQAGDVHRPIATQDQECLCLSVSEAPVSLMSMFGRIINPLLAIRPA